MTRRVGFIGLGHMGGAMAMRLTESYDVLAHDLDARAAERFPQLVASRPDVIARECDLVLLSLPDGAASRAAIAGLGPCAHAGPGIVVDLSTIGPTAAVASAQEAARAGWSYLDAPVSGGVANAIRGTLSVMLAGSDEQLAIAGPVLARLADKPFVVGSEPGLGQAMKLVNNAIALAVLPLTSEAIALGLAHGLDLELMLGVINASSGRTQRSEGMFLSSILTGTFDHGATGEITKKDMELVVDEAMRVGTPIRIAEIVSSIYGEFVEAHPRTDYSFLHDHIVRSGGGPSGS